MVKKFSMLEKLKNRWGIENNWQIIIILFVFSITGSAVLYVKKAIFSLLNIDEFTPLWIKIPLYILTILPAYQILLLIFGAIFGQFAFFYGFQKKSFQRFIGKKKRE